MGRARGGREGIDGAPEVGVRNLVLMLLALGPSVALAAAEDALLAWQVGFS